MKIFAIILSFISMSIVSSSMAAVTPQQAEDFTRMALAGLDREWPYKPGYVFKSEKDLTKPRAQHPVFSGHFDWHSSVHGHWTLVRLLRLHPTQSQAAAVRAALDKRFTADALSREAAFLKENPSFERMYGWAWAMRLGQELRTWDDADAQRWSNNFRPIEDTIVANLTAYLVKLDWPIRCGFHPESAFALAFVHDWAVATKHQPLRELIEKKSRVFYQNDHHYPVAYEPSGNDFFSPCLNVADLMRRVMNDQEYHTWLDAYLPDLRHGKAGNLLTPAKVSDPSDGHLIHLAGLNLSRAWTMRGIASTMPADDPRRTTLDAAATAHTTAGLAMVQSGHYEGEHWLASFAVYLLSDAGL